LDCGRAADAFKETDVADWLAQATPPGVVRFKCYWCDYLYAGLFDERSTRTAHCL
jgi:hypothetical protein